MKLPPVQHRPITSPTATAPVVTAAAPIVTTTATTTSATTTTPPLPPLAPAEPGALTSSTSSTSTSVGINSACLRATRPQAAWSAEAKAIAAEVLANLPVDASRETRVQAAMTALLALPAMQNAHVSCVVADSSGAVIVDHHGAEPTNPCSNGTYAVRGRVQTVAAQTPFKLGCNDADNGGVLERSGGKPVLDVWGTIAADYSKGKTLVMKSPAPLEQVAFAWQDAFEKAGITVGRVDVSAVATAGATLHEHASKSLAQLLQTSLSTSNAFDHEMFALAAAHKQRGGPVSLPETAAALTAFLHEVGVDGAVDGVVANGSGIGNESLVSASAIVALLAQAHTDAKRHPLLEGLARPGLTGTLKGRLLDATAEGIFAGKTGTGEGALALSGVAGELLMSVLVDQMKSKRDDVRAVLDATAIVLCTL